MLEREKIQKAFNQCSDALISLDQKSILKVFHLLSVQFDMVSAMGNANNPPNGNFTDIPTTFTSSDTDLGVEEVSYGNNGEDKKTRKSLPPKKGKKSSNPTYLTDYDFMPASFESLRNFYNKFQNVKEDETRNLVFIYYFQEIRKESTVSINHVFSSYKHLGLKLPAFPSTLHNTKRRKGWITVILKDLKVTREGLNYLEQKLLKTNDE